MSDRDQLVQLRSLPWNRVARRHPGELMIPVRLAGEPGPEPPNVDPRPDDGIAVRGIDLGFVWTHVADMQICNQVGGEWRATIGVRPRDVTPSQTGLWSDVVVANGLLLRPQTDILEIGGSAMTAAGWNMADGARQEIELVGTHLDASTMRVASAIINGIPTDTALPIDVPVINGNVHFFGNSTSSVASVATWYYYLFQRADGTFERWFVDEGAGTSTLSEDSGRDAVITGVENTAWEWFEDTPPPDILTGLVSQADVNTRGRTDDAPFDHVVGGLAAGPTGIGAAGDGGFVPRTYAATGANELPAIPDPSFFDGDFWTIAVRCRQPVSVEGIAYNISSLNGSTRSIALGAGSAVDLAQFFLRDSVNAESVILDEGTGASLVGPEYVLVMVRDGDDVRTYIDDVATPSSPSAFPSTQMDEFNRNEWGSQRGATNPFTGEVFWSSAYDRALAPSDIPGLSAEPNPYTDEPPPSEILLGLVTQADVNTRGRTDDYGFDHIENALMIDDGRNIPDTIVGDGGQIGLEFRGVIDPGYAEFPQPAGGYGFFDGDWTMAGRFAGSHTTGQRHFGITYGAYLVDNTAQQQLAWATTNARMEYTATADDFTGANNVQADDLSVLFTEHTVVLRRTGNQMDFWVDGVLQTGNSTLDSPITNVLSGGWGAAFNFSPGDGSLVNVFWSATYDRAVSDDVIATLSATVNPFVTSDPVP